MYLATAAAAVCLYFYTLSATGVLIYIYIYICSNVYPGNFIYAMIYLLENSSKKINFRIPLTPQSFWCNGLLLFCLFFLIKNKQFAL